MLLGVTSAGIGGSLNIGRIPTDPGPYMMAYVSDAQLYDRALSREELRYLREHPGGMR